MFSAAAVNRACRGPRHSSAAGAPCRPKWTAYIARLVTFQRALREAALRAGRGHYEKQAVVLAQFWRAARSQFTSEK